MGLSGGLADNGGLSLTPVLAPAGSGDVTGATDTAALTAMAADGVTIVLRPFGTYYVTSLPQVTPRRGIVGIGFSTVVNHVGGGSCLVIRNASFPVGGGTPVWVDNMAGRVGGFVIDGTSHTGTGAAGVECGDIYAVNAADILVRNYTAASDRGYWLNNTLGWTEKGRWRNCHTDNCTQGVVWDKNGGTSSFDYSEFDFTVRANANQDGFVFQAATTFDGCTFHLGGNFQGGASNTGVAVRIGSDASAVLLREVEMLWQFETDGAGPVYHTTINKGAAAFVRGHGILKFLNSTQWQAGNVTQPTNAFSFSGIVDVDANLGLNQTGEGLNVLGGSTWSKGQNAVSAGNATVTVPTGDYFSFRLANGANALVLSGTYGGRPRRLLLLMQQPASGAIGTVTWSTPGNNVQGSAQTITWTQGGGAAPILQAANNAFDLVQLVTLDGQNWYATVLSTGGGTRNAVKQTINLTTGNGGLGVSSVQGATPQTVSTPAGAAGLELIGYTWSYTPNGSASETITLQIVATFDDTTTATLTAANTTASVSAVTINSNVGNVATLWKNGHYVTGLSITAADSLGATTAAPALTILALPVN